MNKNRIDVSNALLALITKMNFPWKQPPALGARDWESEPNADQPACFLLKVGEDIMQERVFGAAKYILHYKILCYFRGDAQPNTAPETYFDAALDQFDAIFKSGPPGLANTLGGLVAHAWIEGATVIAGGIFDPQIVVSVPIKVLTGD